MSTNRTAKADLVVRLRRIEGQIRGIARMVENDRHCPEVLDQIAAATRALERVGLGVLDAHVQRCLTPAAGADGAPQERQLEEVRTAIARFLRTARPP